MPASRGWAAVGVAGALLILWATFGEIELLATAVFLLLAVGGGIAFVRAMSPRLGLTRQIHPLPVHEGEQVTVEVEIVAARRARNLVIEETVQGLGSVRFAAALTAPNQRLTARYEVYCRARGIYQVGPAEASVADPFALTERRTALGGVDRLTVYPAVEALDGFPALRGLDPAVQSNRPTFVPHGGEDFFTLREYQIGDDLRKVHWPSSAKRDELMIRQLEVPWQARALVLLDQRAERYPSPEAFEHAVRGAASVVAHLYQGGFSPELWTTERAPGLRSDSRYTQAMEMLATVGAAHHLDLHRTISRLRRSGVGGGALVIVTGTADENLLGAFRALAQDFARTVVLAVAERPGDMLATFQRAGAITVVTGPSTPWAPAWHTAMELSWSTATAG
jgi:uncharacterized protein (DUF58 family)